MRPGEDRAAGRVTDNEAGKAMSDGMGAEPKQAAPTQAELDAAVRRESARHTRRSFLAAGIAAAGGYGLYRWIDRSAMEGRQPLPLRRAFQSNAAIARTVFGERGLAPTYPVSQAQEMRFNGNFGLREELVEESWRLQLVGVEGAERHSQYSPDVTAWEYRYAAEAPDPKAPVEHDFKSAVPQGAHVRKRGSEEAGPSASGLRAGTPGLLLTIGELKSLPHVELVTEFKCIEGWSQIAHWGGVRLADLIARYPPAKTADGGMPRYVYMETPDGDYYGGYDMQACLHPQSLLAMEMSGRPLSRWHGAPVRLHMPIKYGYKQIKRIGLIAYTDLRPDDYWTKLGYDWYAGL